MSDTQVGPGWWIASDGKWYPAELHPAAQPIPSTAPPGFAPFGPAPTVPQYFVPPGPNNGLAVASLILAIAGIVPFFFGLPCVLAIIFGFVSLGQIKQTGNVQRGRGMAIAGIVIGFALIALFLVAVVIAAAVSNNNNF